ncbi:helix-turn-helix domain-containing protein [Streptacidiphilus carbonis]|uniref:helix-turn-helix domain-containing protein n=1 Tax=Streptacidiphilus carbonis TaxID=105422 RepID=UPI0005A6347A|nr:transcriptional regulator [Streptacidiphilus carbonis]
MSGEHDDFARWLRERARIAGFDLDQRGMTSRLAEASGIDPAQMSRAVRGLSVPAIEGQRGLAKALGLKLPEVMIRAGSATPDDFPPQWDLDDSPAPPLSSRDIESVYLTMYASRFRITDQDTRRFIRMVKALATELGHGHIEDEQPASDG